MVIKQHLKKIVLFMIFLLTFGLIDLIFIYNIRIDIEYSSTQLGSLVAYTAKNGEDFSTETTESFNINNQNKEGVASWHIEDTTDIFRLDFEENLTQLFISGITVSYNDIPIKKFSADNISLLPLNSLAPTVENGIVELMLVESDPHFIIHLGTSVKLVYFAVKALTYLLISFILTAIVFSFKKVSANNLFIFIVAIMLIMPTYIYRLFGIEASAELENATLADKPGIIADGIVDYPDLYEEYYNDHIPFKDELVAVNSFLNYNLFQKATGSNLIVGNDGWLFNEDVTNNYLKPNRFNEQELMQISDSLNKIHEDYISRGIEMYMVFAPSKATVYNEYLPLGYIPEDGMSRLEALMEHLEKHTEIEFIYLYDDLLEHKENNQLYYQNDTHWNHKGGYIAFEAICNMLEIQNIPPFEEMTFSESSDPHKDLIDLLNMDIPNYDVRYTANFSLNSQSELLFTNAPNFPTIHEYESSSLNDESVLFICDSYTAFIRDLMGETFGRFTAFNGPYDPVFVDEFEPDIVVFEYVEHQLDRLLKL